jgi:hypothetical protein
LANFATGGTIYISVTLVVQDAAMSFKVTTSTSAGTSMWGPCAAIGLAAVLLFASASYAQGGRAPADGPVTGTAPNIAVPVNPKTQSCTALKAQLNAAGEMSILSGPKGAWGDTFYGPAVPRCQFWQMPVFTYVKASDGLCGVGYICVEKLTFD